LPRASIIALLLVASALVLVGLLTGMDDSDDSAAEMGCAAGITGLEPAQERNAKIIAGAAQDHGLGNTGATIGIAASLAESRLFNYANDGSSDLVGSLEGRQLSSVERLIARRSLQYPNDGIGNNLDSIGIFQQRPTSGWGPPEDLIDPVKSAGLFFDKLVKVPDWRSKEPWEAAQAVQGSPSTNGEIYQRSYEEAVDIVDDLSAAGDQASAATSNVQVCAA
jgi:hypothetical protein